MMGRKILPAVLEIESIRRNSTFVSPSREAVSLAFSSIFLDKSTPRTLPFFPTLRAARIAEAPVPVPNVEYSFAGLQPGEVYHVFARLSCCRDEVSVPNL